MSPKLLASNSLECRESRIPRTQPRTKNSTQRPSNRGGFPALEGSRSSTKRYNALTNDPLKEIRTKTLSNLWNQPKNENTKEAPKKTHGNHNSKSSIQPRKSSTRSSLPPQHPSLSQDLTMKLSS
jgi:hypothetical protein